MLVSGAVGDAAGAKAAAVTAMMANRELAIETDVLRRELGVTDADLCLARVGATGDAAALAGAQAVVAAERTSRARTIGPKRWCASTRGHSPTSKWSQMRLGERCGADGGGASASKRSLKSATMRFSSCSNWLATAARSCASLRPEVVLTDESIWPDIVVVVVVDCDVDDLRSAHAA